MPDLSSEAAFEGLFEQFLTTHPAHHTQYRVLPDGDVQIQPALYDAFIWWCCEQGYLTLEQATQAYAMNRALVAGHFPWVTGRE